MILQRLKKIDTTGKLLLIKLGLLWCTLVSTIVLVDFSKNHVICVFILYVQFMAVLYAMHQYTPWISVASKHDTTI